METRFFLAFFRITFAPDTVGIFVGRFGRDGADARNSRWHREAEFVSGQNPKRVVRPRRRSNVEGHSVGVDEAGL